jgi:hypothetical protein
MKNYVGSRLCGIPPEDMEGLRVVDTDGDEGIVIGAKVYTSQIKDDPSRTIIITVQWKAKGRHSGYHWMFGWPTVVDAQASAMEVKILKDRLAKLYSEVLQHPRLTVRVPEKPKDKGWFAKFRDLLRI